LSLLGIDVGTSGCKAVAFSTDGEPLASAREEYDLVVPGPGLAELDAELVWDAIKRVIAEVAAATVSDPVSAICSSSFGESMVPVTTGRRILGRSILNFDARGEEYLGGLQAGVNDERLFGINGNALGNHYSVTKLMWVRDNQPDVYQRADVFLNLAGFVGFMLGGDPAVDYSLANRTLLFDLEQRAWSDELVRWAGLERQKLPGVVPSGTAVGQVSPLMAGELGLSAGTAIVSGAHDQCSNAVGCGATRDGDAMLGMGTYLCVMPAYQERPAARTMIERGLSTEHHAAPDLFVSFVYNMGGAIVKWFRDTFAAEEWNQARVRGDDIYTQLFSELPDLPSPIAVLPHFSPMGPPDYISDSSGVFIGLSLETRRGDILKGILEGSAFSLKEGVGLLEGAGISISGYRAVGGGSRSDAWVQLWADVLEAPVERSRVAEAGALGAAIMAGVGTGVFRSFGEGVAAMVGPADLFSPREEVAEQYRAAFERYRRLWPLLKEFLREGGSATSLPSAPGRC